MKSIFKFMTVALAAVAVSCTDDLNLEQKGYVAKEGDLNGTLYTAEPTRVAMLEDVGSSTTPVWSKGDLVNVFSASKLNYNQYSLAAGEGTPKGIFQPLGTPDLIGLTDLYAITEADYQYGVSATKENDGKVLLTAEIPQDFEWSKLAAEQNSYKLPSPYWGAASFGDDGQLNVFFRPLTGILRLDLALLPAGVQGIVLVTGNNTEYFNHQYFINPEIVDGEPVFVDGLTGSSEGLSGHFNTVLNYQNQTDYKPLGNDRALVCYDTLRVDFPKATVAKENKVVYIPLIAQHYDNLKVLAVTGDYLEPYAWDGQILREYNDLTVENGDIINLAMTAELTLQTSSLLEASELIAQKIDGKHILNISLPNIVATDADHTLYIVSNLNKATDKTHVIVNFPNDLDHGIEIAEKEAVWTGNVPNDGAQFFRWGDETYVEDFDNLFVTGMSQQPAPTVEPQKAVRNVTLNFSGFVSDFIDITLPTSNVILNYQGGDESSADDDSDDDDSDDDDDDDDTEAEGFPVVNILCANTKDVSGYDYDNTYNAVSLEQNAALKFKGVYGVVNYYSGGAVYFFDEESEITESLNIFGKEPKGLRITDALINTITYPYIKNVDQGTTNKTWIYTTGSAAIKQLKDPTDKVKIKAYWSSKRLTPYAVANGYEGVGTHDDGDGDTQQNYNIAKGAIYTAAQLQGMGLAQEVYNYTISPKVESIWLGGVTFPWIGAEVELLSGATATSLPKGTGEPMSSPFSLDGRNCTLKNMILDIYDPNLVLPGCCGTTQKIRVQRNLGLIRTIRTSYESDETDESKDEAVLIKNIQLDDVLLNTGRWAIDNVGSLVGIIESVGNVTIGGSEKSKVGTTTSNFTDIRIISQGNNIGGIVGELESKMDVNISKVNVESIEDNKTYIHGGHIEGNNNVGGIVGRLTYYNAYDDPNNRPAAGTTTTDKNYFDYKFIPIVRGKDEAGQVFTHNLVNGKDQREKDNELSELYAAAIAENATDDAKNLWNAAINSLWYINNGEWTKENLKTTQKVNNQTVTIVVTPVSDRVYYESENEDAPTNTTTSKLGSLELGKDNRANFVANGNVVNVNSEPIFVPKADNTDDSGDLPVAIKTEYQQVYKDSYTSDWEDAPALKTWNTVTYYIMKATNNPKSFTTGGGYPTALTVSNASVKLVPTTESGIILGEDGSNVGGMFGYAAADGPVVMQSAISVEVPTITATTEEEPAEIGIQTEAGNHVGGLVGNFQNINKGTGTDQIQNKFSGNIKATTGIIAEGAKAGGVIGLQTTKMFTHATDHSDASQVVYAPGTGDVILVEAGVIKAINGHAGGVIGYQEAGKVEIAPANKTVTVKANLAGAYAVGGAIGEQNDDARIASGSVKFTATIGDMNITKGLSFFPENTDREMLGSFGTAIGIKNHWLEINKDLMATTVAGKATLSDAKKKELLFHKHNSAANTEVILEGYAFYGDNAGWVGYARETSMYFGNNAVQGNYKMNIYEKY